MIPLFFVGRWQQLQVDGNAGNLNSRGDLHFKHIGRFFPLKKWQFSQFHGATLISELPIGSDDVLDEGLRSFSCIAIAMGVDISGIW